MTANSCERHPSIASCGPQKETILVGRTVTCVGCVLLLSVCRAARMPVLLITWLAAGIGFAKHNNRGVIHLYRWTAESTRVAETRLEIDAHENGVHDLALTNLDGSLVAVSGGGDCRVKVWSATSGQLMFCFVGAAERPSRA